MSEDLCHRDLTVPDDDSQTVRTLLSRYLARQYRDFLKLRAPRKSEAGRILTALQRHCREVAGIAPGAVFSALQRSNAGGLVRYLAIGAIDTPQAGERIAELATILYGELALAGHAPPAMVVTPPPRRIILMSTGHLAELPVDTKALRLHEQGLTYVGNAGPATLEWSAFQEASAPEIHPAFARLPGGPSVALADDSPLAEQETHPDKQGNRLDLGGQPVSMWTEKMQEGLDLVRIGVPTVADEIAMLIQQLVPVGYSEEQHLSASFQELVGTIYLSLHPNPLTLAEALIHEHSHNKINMLWTFAPVLDNAFSPLYPSPYRPDERPLHGVLLGVHAFLPVERLYENLIAAGHPGTKDPRFERQRSAVRDRNAAGCATLEKYGQPSEAGRSVMDEISRWNEYFSRM